MTDTQGPRLTRVTVAAAGISASRIAESAREQVKDRGIEEAR